MRPATSPLPAPGPDPLRADARRNRERILTAAREVFAERGIDVPLTAVARRAGVGMATLHRRFPTKESLITAVFHEQFTACVAVIDAGLADPDPWRGFNTVLVEGFALLAADRGFSAAVTSAFPDAVGTGTERRRAFDGFATLTRSAQASGRLRPDFSPTDLGLLVAAVNGVTTLLPGDAAAVSRLVSYLIDALETRPDRGPDGRCGTTGR
jgi:AcrR family transcriptional regulator